MTAAALQTEGLGLCFGDFQAVSNVNLMLAPGARQALIGPNGAGKTTLINLLTGTYRPSSGRILMNGRDITATAVDQRARAGLARTFQINTLFPSLSPLQSVLLALAQREGLGGVWWRALARQTALYDEAHALLARLKLASVAQLPVAELAYGKQRLLLDEPAAGVPAGESGELFEVIAELPAEISILFIEHDMDLVFRFAQRISVLVAGAILVEGSPAEVARDPRVREVYLGPDHRALQPHG